MAKGNDRNYVSFWFWFFAMFVMALPCIGIVMMLVWGFVGENESRKNYFRALIAWTLLVTAIWGTLLMLGCLPLLQKQIEEWIQSPKSR